MEVFEIIDGSLWRLRLVENLKVVLEIKHFNHLFFSFFFFFYFFGSWLRWGCFVLGLTWQKRLYF